MRHFIFLLTILAASVMAPVNCIAQVAGINFGLHGFADNREYSDAGLPAPTHFGINATPQIFIQSDTIHYVAAGASLTKLFGSTHGIDKTELILYYRFKQNGWQLNVGSFKRDSLVTDYPLALLSDTLNYFRPLMQGLYGSYTGKHIRTNLWIDWTSLQQAHTREKFLFGASAQANLNHFFGSAYLYMHHNAKPALAQPGDYVQDNGALNINAGYRLLNPLNPLQLQMAAGVLTGFVRTRNSSSNWYTPSGILLSAQLQYRRFRVANTFYSGKPQQSDYGDQFYSFSSYNRTDLEWHMLNYKHVQARFNFALHVTPIGLGTQQTLNIVYNFAAGTSIKKLHP